MSDTQSDTSKPLPLYGADTTKAQHDSVTHTYMSHSCNGSYVSQSYMDRLVSKLIGKQSSTGMSFLRFVTICAVISICLPFIVVIMGVMVVAYTVITVIYLPCRLFVEWMRSDIVEDDKDMVDEKDMAYRSWRWNRGDKDMVTKNMECQYCDSPDHVTKNCPHRNVNWPETGVTQ